MKYYQHFDLLNWRDVSAKVLAYYLEHKADYQSQPNPAFKFTATKDILEKIPEINQMLASVNATTKEVWVFELNNYTSAEKMIHADGAPYNSRFLLPLLNCENTETRFYTTNEPLVPIGHVYKEGHSLPMIPKFETCTHVDTLFVERGPALIRVNEIHSIVLPENFISPRITMMLDINEDLTHLLD